MKYYLAPLEGITGYIFRNAHQKYFTSADKYFTPFLVPKPNTGKQFTAKELADILPEHNQGIYLVPQIMTNKAEDFVTMANALQEYGYQEINLNLGCPSKTVVSKGRGSGFLSDTEKLNRFFDFVFSHTNLKISVKTRIGLHDPDEFPDLIQIYNQFPFEELIIHPRIQSMYYNGKPDLTAFAYACETSKNPLCYNGDIFRASDFHSILARFSVPSVMFGRGLVANPGLIDEIVSQKFMEKLTFRAFHDQLLEEYRQAFHNDVNAMFRMKEFWYYAADMFTDSSSYAKKIRKTKNFVIYNQIVDRLFDEQELMAGAGFSCISS